MMPDELIDICDESGQNKGTALKSVAHKEGLWHYSIHCWIVRPSNGGSVLFQKRGSDKALFPDFFDISAAGHYRAGEKVEEGVREIVEELGVSVDFSQLVPLGVKIDVGIYDNITNREFCHVFLLKDDRPISGYKLAEEEVEGLVEIAIDDGLALFSGTSKTAKCTGTVLDKNKGSWVSTTREATQSDFIPRIDPYYLKVFIMAQRLLRGESPLAI